MNPDDPKSVAKYLRDYGRKTANSGALSAWDCHSAAANMVDQQAKRIAELEAENSELKAIVERLHRTADKVWIGAGRTVWHPEWGELKIDGLARLDNPDSEYHKHGMPISVCYSTREAAEAAKQNPSQSD